MSANLNMQINWQALLPRYLKKYSPYAQNLNCRTNCGIKYSISAGQCSPVKAALDATLHVAKAHEPKLAGETTDKS